MTSKDKLIEFLKSANITYELNIYQPMKNGCYISLLSSGDEYYWFRFNEEGEVIDYSGVDNG